MASTGWPDLPPDLLGSVIARLPFPGDRARICVVCRAWRSAARRHVRHQHPWLVLPDGSFCTTGRDGAFFHRIPGLPDNATCIAATDVWLALDCTDDVFRRTPVMDNFCYETGMFVVVARPDVKHRHTYLLHNPFSGEIVPLPELDAIIGHVAETFEVRKVLMRSSTNPEDLVAVTTSNWNYKSSCAAPARVRMCCPTSESLTSHSWETRYMGSPRATNSSPSISVRTTMAGLRSDDDYEYDGGEKDDGSEESNDEDETPNQEKDVNEKENQEEDDEAEAANPEEEEVVDSSFNADYGVSDYDVREGDDWAEVPYEAKDETCTARYLVPSLSGELLLVRHQYESTLHSGAYTSKVEVFKADVMAGRWIPVTAHDRLGKDEALFLSRSFSKSVHAHGDVEEGLVHYTSGCLDDVLDTRSWTIRRMTFRLPWQRDQAHDDWHIWLFPPS
ncbi:uncharacterized protein C2845_PM13G00550 [Panicum miliaceum]|uniref:F-box domain-containing protein n=1 Tax=Panicum miliaceum TaxID=4540 RepID=A0A3L6RGV0_PANMI|nr:uncharacterized protein C2845_PM13G00550 [Panicum miliaceum]